MAEVSPDTVVDIQNGLREARNEVEALKTRLATQEETLVRRLEPRENLIAIDYQVLRDLVAANYQGIEDRLAKLENRPFEQLFLDALDHYRLQALQHSSNIFQLETTNNVLQLRRQVASLETRLTQEQLGRLRPLSERIEGIERNVERLEQRAMAIEARSNAQRAAQSVGNRASLATDAARRAANPGHDGAGTRATELAGTYLTEVAGTHPTGVTSTRPRQEAPSSSFHPAVNPVLETTANQHPTVRGPWDRAYTKEEEEDAIREVYGEDYIPNRRMRSVIPSTVQVTAQQSSAPAFGFTDEEVEEQVRAFYSREPSQQGMKSTFAPQPLSRLSPNVDRTKTFKKTDLHLSRYATKTPEPIDPAIALAKFEAAALKSSIKIRNPNEAQGENKKSSGWTFDNPTYADKEEGKDQQPVGIWSPIIAESEGPSEPFPPFDPTVGVIDGVFHSDLAFDRPLFLPPASDQGNWLSPPRSSSTVMQPEHTTPHADIMQNLQKAADAVDEQKKICKSILEHVKVIGKKWRSQSTEQSDQSETSSPSVQNARVGTRILGSLLDPQSKALVLKRNQRPQDIPTLRLASTLSKNETVYINEAVIGILRGHITTYIGDLTRSPFRNATITIHLTIDSSGMPSIFLVGHIYDTGARSSFMFEEGREVSYRKYSLQFAIPDCLVPGSLELGTVPDVMLLPTSVAASLRDPNEVPDNLRYMAFHFKDRVATGFDTKLMPNAHDMVSEDGMSADAIKFFKFMGYFAAQQEGSVRVWFLAKGGEVDELFTKMRAVSAGGLPKVWKDRTVVWKATEVDGRVFWRL